MIAVPILAYNHRNRCMGNEEKKVDYRQKAYRK